MKGILLRGGRLLDPDRQLDVVQDLYLADERIVGVGMPPADFQTERIIDVHGHWIWPGIFDLCAQVNADRLAVEGRAASAAGITDLCVPPDIHPCLDNPAAVDLVRLASEAQAQVNIHIIGGLTQTLAGSVLAELATLRQAGCVAVSNGRRSVVDSQVLRRAMEYAASHDLTVLLHAEDSWLRGHGCAHEGATATRLGLPAIPAAAEVIGLYRDLALVELTGVRAHFCRLTSAESVRLIAQAKARGLPVSADVAMHHLHLCDRDLTDFDTNCHVDPPLRAQADRDALRQGLANGVIDAICSDHRPLGADAKLAPFPRSKPGISALAALVPLLLRLVDEGCMTLSTAVASLTQRPAALVGLQPSTLRFGARADLCVIDPQTNWRLERETLHGSGLNTPFLNQEMRGRVVLTIRAGRIVHELASQSGQQHAQ